MRPSPLPAYGPSMTSTTPSPATTAPIADPIRRFAELSSADVPYAGGKGANLGQLTRAGFPVPDGFVVGAPAYAAFCAETGLSERLTATLDGLDVENTDELQQAAERAAQLVKASVMPAWLADAISRAYEQLVGDQPDAPVAVRSSATGEDTASASFAGMNETFLNMHGAESVIGAVQRCWASLFGARTIYYRAKRGFGAADMDIAVVVERQIASTRAGVMFTVDPASQDAGRLVIEGAFGLGEAVVSGQVSPDRYVVDKAHRSIVVRSVRPKELTIESAANGGTVTRPLTAEESHRAVLSDEEVLKLTDLGVAIEAAYGSPQDTEWAFDDAGAVWMLQSRPITTLGPAETAEPADVLLRGLGAAPGQAGGAARLLTSLKDAANLDPGDVLVTHMTAPDWVPLMRKAAAVVTDSGGMTCHAAIVSRELGIPCVVGTGDATQKLRDGELITVNATDGTVLRGISAAPASPATVGAAAAPASLATVAVTGTRLLVNLSEPSQAQAAAMLDVDGVGLLRAELMIVEALDGVHPRTLLAEGRGNQFVERMAAGLNTFAAAFAPRPITYRTTDFRTNEFRGLRGGEQYEPEEANPMIGYRGALRYTMDPEVFALELDAIARVWDAGHHNFHVMLPFVRTAHELARCRELIADAGLLHRPGFELWVMAEVPSVLFNLERYARLGVAGISIGSNDLTQLLLGADRDSETLADTFDERDPAVADYLRQLIPRARAAGLQTSICGQAPSVHPEYAELLVDAGIDAISVSVDAVERTRRLIAAAEQRLLLRGARRSSSTPDLGDTNV